MKPFYAILVIIAIGFLMSCKDVKPGFAEKIIDDHVPENLWMKTTGDINEDGKIDILVGGWMSGGMVAYLAPDWKKQTINDSLKIATDAEVCDIDNNGIPDVVAVLDLAIAWFSGPDWNLHIIDSIVGHDVEVSDFDNDGIIDLVVRNQGAFGNSGGHTVYSYDQKPIGTWTKYQKEILDGEGKGWQTLITIKKWIS